MRRLLLCSALFLLSGCLDIETTFDLADSSSVMTSIDMIVAPDLVATMKPNEFEKLCSGGAVSRQADGVHCSMKKGFDIDMAAYQSQNGGQFRQDFPMVRIERIGDTHFRFSADLGQFAQAIRAGMKPSDLNAYRNNRKYFDGHAWVMNVRGSRIISTNGTVSLDGTTATKRGPIIDIFDAGVDFGPVFVTELETVDTCEVSDCD